MERRGKADTCYNEQSRNLQLQFQKKTNWHSKNLPLMFLYFPISFFFLTKGKLGSSLQIPMHRSKGLTNLGFTEFLKRRYRVDAATNAYNQGPKAPYNLNHLCQGTGPSLRTPEKLLDDSKVLSSKGKMPGWIKNVSYVISTFKSNVIVLDSLQKH